jgi:aspartyl protease family protein
MKQVEPSNKISRMMVSFAWIGLLSMLALGFDSYLEKQANPNQRPDVVVASDGSAEVTLVQNRQGHYVADGKLNDEWATFVLDTGATNISIPAYIAERLDLKGGHPEKTRTANGVITVYRVVLESVTLGAIKLLNVPAHINPHMTGKQVLLGMSFLRHVEMSQKGQQLTLSIKPEEGSQKNSI